MSSYSPAGLPVGAGADRSLGRFHGGAYDKATGRLAHFRRPHAARGPGRDRGRATVSYARARRSARAARRAALGVAPGDRVATTLRRARLRRAAPRDAAARRGSCRSAPAAAGATVEPRSRRRPRELRADAEHAAAVIHTSGTTGEPKPVALTYGNFQASAAARRRTSASSPTTAGSARCRSSTSAACRSSRARRSTARAPCCTSASTPSACATRSSRARRRWSRSCPTMLRRLRDAGLERAPALRAALIGGGPVPRDLLDWAPTPGCRSCPTYGMTETCSQIATPRRRRLPPLPGVEVRIADDGELLVRGPDGGAGATATAGSTRATAATSTRRPLHVRAGSRT